MQKAIGDWASQKAARVALQNAGFREKCVDMSQIMLQDKCHFSSRNACFRCNSVFVYVQRRVNRVRI